MSDAVVGKKEEKCAICLNAIKHLASINGCSHQFCYDCIKQWSESALRCPLCQKEYKTLQHKKLDNPNCVFESEVLPQPTKKIVDTAQPDFAGLTDSYFLAEISRLQINAEKAKRDLFSGSSNKRRDDYGHGRLLEVISKLKSLDSLVKSDAGYNPNNLLTDLYQIDYILRVLWTGNSSQLVSVPQVTSPVTQRRYGADDAFCDEGEDEENVDYDELDDYDEYTY